MERKKVSIVVTSRNRLDYLDACIKSIKENTPDIYNLFIIDSGSTPENEKIIFEKYRNEGTLIFDRYNLSFAEAVNYVARNCFTEFFFMLNNDCSVEPNWVEPMIELMGKDPKVGVAAPLMLRGNGKVLSHGANLDKVGNTVIPYMDYNPDDKVFFEKPSNWAYCGFWFIRMDLFRELNYLPEYPVPIYWDDPCLGLGVNSLGYDIRLCPQSRVYHYLVPSDREHHQGALAKGREHFLVDWGQFLEENNGYYPECPKKDKIIPYRNK